MMSRAFIEEFSLPEPDYDLTVGSGSHAYQTATTMLKIERLFRRNTRPSVCMVPGDTNSAIGAALGSIKVKVPVAHLEAGLRCREEFMPEEINRKLIDHCSQLLFAPTYG
jgi:UDP-N-acetylglucosamine 2-epimerase (non-hydrolysing)